MPFQWIEAPCVDPPTRLADGLELESAPVHAWTLAPESAPADPLVPPFQRWPLRLKLFPNQRGVEVRTSAELGCARHYF